MVDVQLVICKVSFVCWFLACSEAMVVAARVSRRSLAAVVVAVVVALWLRLRRLPPPKFQRPTCAADCPAVPRMRWIRTGMARVPCEPFVEGSLFLNPAALSLCVVVAFQD